MTRQLPFRRGLTWFSLFLFPVAGWATASIGEAAANLLAPTAILTKLLLLASYIVGVALILGALAQYKIHRQNPKQVPLTTPITLLILGIMAVCMPAATKMFGPTYSAEEYLRKDKKPTLLPLPDVKRRGPSLPLPRRDEPASSEGESSVDVYPQGPTEEGRGGHWTEDPRYNQ